MRVSLAGVVSRSAPTPFSTASTWRSGRARGSASSAPTGPASRRCSACSRGSSEPDEGRVERTPATLTVGYLPQEHDRRAGRDAARLPRPAHRRRRGGGGRRAAHDRLEPGRRTRPRSSASSRSAAPTSRRGRARVVRRPRPRRSRSTRRRRRSPAARRRAPGWRRSCSRASTSCCSTSRRTTSTSTGSSGSSASSTRFAGGLAVVSHDRAFLDRTVTRIAEIDPWTAAVTEYAGGWSDYAAARELARRAAVRRLRALRRSGGARSRRS